MVPIANRALNLQLIIDANLMEGVENIFIPMQFANHWALLICDSVASRIILVNRDRAYAYTPLQRFG